VIPDQLSRHVEWRGFLAWSARINPDLYVAAENVNRQIKNGLLDS
jgi:hypothetical protein